MDLLYALYDSCKAIAQKRVALRWARAYLRRALRPIGGCGARLALVASAYLPPLPNRIRCRNSLPAAPHRTAPQNGPRPR